MTLGRQEFPEVGQDIYLKTSGQYAPNLISRQPKRKPYSQVRNLLQKGSLNYIPQIREWLDARKKKNNGNEDAHL
jgi:hypothetical protein